MSDIADQIATIRERYGKARMLDLSKRFKNLATVRRDESLLGDALGIVAGPRSRLTLSPATLVERAAIPASTFSLEEADAKFDKMLRIQNASFVDDGGTLWSMGPAIQLADNDGVILLLDKYDGYMIDKYDGYMIGFFARWLYHPRAFDEAVRA